MAFGRKTTAVEPKFEQVPPPPIDPVVSAIGALRDEVVKLRRDVQRAGIMSGLMSRPGGHDFKSILASANAMEKMIED